jgi:hypothetical protein
MTDDAKTYTLVLPDENGDRREIEISTAQMLDLGAGRAISYMVDEEHFVDEDGRVITRESAVPKKEEESDD